MAYATTDILLMRFIRQGGRHLTDRVEIIRLDISLLNELLQPLHTTVGSTPLPFFRQSHQCHRIIEVIEKDCLPIKDVIHIRGIILFLMLIFHRDILEITHSIKGGISIQPTVGNIITDNLEMFQETIDDFIHTVVVIHHGALHIAVRISTDTLPMRDRHGCYRIHTDE